MTFETPPRGSGQHRKGDATSPASERARRLRRPDPRVSYYPADEDDDTPTDPTMRAPLNEVPIREVPPRRPGGTEYRDLRQYQDLVVPRVYIEPDEDMDRLRVRALRWGIARDALAVLVLVYAIGWLLRPLWQLFL